MTKKQLQQIAEEAGLPNKLVDLDALIGAKKGYLSNMRGEHLPPLVANFFKLAIETRRPRKTLTLEVKDLGETLEVKKDKTTLMFPYNSEKSYIANILSYFPNFGIVDFKNIDDIGVITLKEF